MHFGSIQIDDIQRAKASHDARIRSYRYGRRMAVIAAGRGYLVYRADRIPKSVAIVSIISPSDIDTIQAAACA